MMNIMKESAGGEWCIDRTMDTLAYMKLGNNCGTCMYKTQHETDMPCSDCCACIGGYNSYFTQKEAQK